MSPLHKPIAWLSGKPTTPPLSNAARIEIGYLFRFVQSGMLLSMPKNRPMPRIGRNCHELRINDENLTWRFYYRIDEDSVVCAEWNCKKTEQTPQAIIELCKNRLKAYDLKMGGSK